MLPLFLAPSVLGSAAADMVPALVPPSTRCGAVRQLPIQSVTPRLTCMRPGRPRTSCSCSGQQNVAGAAALAWPSPSPTLQSLPYNPYRLPLPQQHLPLNPEPPAIPRTPEPTVAWQPSSRSTLTPIPTPSLDPATLLTTKHPDPNAPKGSIWSGVRAGKRPKAALTRPPLSPAPAPCVMKRSCACASALSFSFTFRDWVVYQ